MSTEQRADGLEQYAPNWSLKAAGALLVLTLALNNVGINFSPVMQASKQAWTAKIASDMNSSNECITADTRVDVLVKDMKMVKSMAHATRK